jgi:hypothetical protein
MYLFKTIEGGSGHKTVDYLRLSKHAVEYLFHNIGLPYTQDAFRIMTRVIQAVLVYTCDYDPEDPEERKPAYRRMALQVYEALALMERDYPHSELSTYLHELVHIPSAMWR